MTTTDLIISWLAEAIALRAAAHQHRNNGMYETARNERLRADQLVDCATELQRITPPTVAEPTAQTDRPSPSPASNSPLTHADAPQAASEARLELLWLLMRTPRRFLPADSMMRALSRAVAMHGPAALEASEDRVRVILARLRAQLERAGQILAPPDAGAPNAACGSTAPTPHAHAEAPAQPAPPAPLQVLPKSSDQPSCPDPQAATGF